MLEIIKKYIPLKKNTTNIVDIKINNIIKIGKLQIIKNNLKNSYKEIEKNNIYKNNKELIKIGEIKEFKINNIEENLIFYNKKDFLNLIIKEITKDIKKNIINEILLHYSEKESLIYKIDETNFLPKNNIKKLSKFHNTILNLNLKLLKEFIQKNKFININSKHFNKYNHISIIGSCGSGKTVFNINIIKQLIKQNKGFLIYTSVISEYNEIVELLKSKVSQNQNIYKYNLSIHENKKTINKNNTIEIEYLDFVGIDTLLNSKIIFNNIEETYLV